MIIQKKDLIMLIHIRTFVFVSALGLLVMVTGCRSPQPVGGTMETYLAAMHRTAPENMALAEPGSEVEARAIEQFLDLFTRFDEDALRGGITALYAEEVFFNDTLVELNTAAEVEAYFLHTLEHVVECRFDLVDVASNKGEHYFRWVMTFRMERYRNDPPNVSLGMTHVRFNADGQVVFHQDYWDSANLYGQFPVIGPLMRWFHRRVAKSAT